MSETQLLNGSYVALQLQQDLHSFEKLYGLSSEIFYEQFQAGKMDDRMDFVEWASLVQMAHHLQVRLNVPAKN